MTRGVDRRKWSDDETVTLARMVSGGVPMAEMMAALGRSRNAINGQLARTGLAKMRPKETRSLAQFREARRKAVAAAAAARSDQASRAPVRLPPAPYRADPDLDIAPADRRTIATLGDAECRWPFGDPREPVLFLRQGEDCRAFLLRVSRPPCVSAAAGANRKARRSRNPGRWRRFWRWGWKVHRRGADGLWRRS